MTKENRFISQITHLICAKCGSDVILDNRHDTDTLIFEDMNNDQFNQLIFKCPECKEQYDLPCKLIRY